MRGDQQTMPMEKHCLVCGAALSLNVPSGHCPKCLLNLAWSAHLSEIPTQSQESILPPNLKTSPAIEDEQLFGDYELGPEIARGGMGVVYRARQISLNRAVALKMIARGEFASAMLVARFQIEAGAAARLDHPNIVPIYEIGEFRGQVYYSMKLVEGGNLAGQISNSSSPFSNEDAARLLIKIAEAIHYAHQHGVLHRDLKPSNILIDASGPRVTDFGLAKVLEEEGGITLSTATLGTPAYMAPEQAAGRAKEVSTAADIYSLGAILFEMLTGRPPFQAESAFGMMRQ
ncbi:MAG: hypothetical protein DME26_14625 [Verrucomicrobia bacterium]|nr:MAG: hypothetical protein DME26_14625 [Verrucomicrobiota bacterium]